MFKSNLQKGSALGWVVGILIVAIFVIVGIGLANRGDVTNGNGNGNGIGNGNGNGDGSATTTIDTVDVYLVRLDDGGENGRLIGCNDSLVAVERDIEPTQAVLRSALNELLSIPATTTINGVEYYNGLHLSADATIGEGLQVENGVATVPLTGILAGGTCDDPRIEEQLRATVLQFPTVDSADITINGEDIDDFFDASGQGGMGK